MNDNFYDDDMDDFDDLDDWLNDPDLESLERRDIPENLHSVYLEGPFTNCISCDKDLISSPQPYEIEKVFKGKEVVFEYAICLDCGKNLMKEFSKESSAASEEYMVKHYQPSSDWEECHLCQSSSEEFSEYSVRAMCQGSQMLAFIVICHKCMEKMQELISEQTRKTMGDFIENNFPGIPAEFNPAPLLKA